MILRGAPKSLIAGSVLLLGCLLPATMAWIWHGGHAPFIDIPNRYAPPSLAHPLGTDPFGRDLASYVLTGAFNTTAIALLSVALATVIGTILGLVGANGGKRGWAVMSATDLGLAFPPILIAAMLVTAQGASATGEILAIALFGIPAQIRITKQAAQSILVLDYISAARMAGFGSVAVTIRHVLPNIAPILIVHASTSLALAILSEAGLSYLGLGAPPPQPDLGRALASYQIHIFDHPFLVAVPGVTVMVLVLGFNLLGDGLRDLLERPFARNEERLP
ncbi:peptide ABC transporter permease [Gluconobacter oxydans]|uniref:ABC transporter permease n=1 Tax=Gluconobacter thailandicus TaxID=257438 RepID=UPI00029989EA|nr:ABC transporter permease [Gluconobacter thailandicus]AFW02420.1 peptide ABC transporter permease [Gluconobacter oxydans H24]ANQ42070.1 peptide ABC transporter permease [Gluconobacter oxydans]